MPAIGNIRVFSASASRPLAKGICKEMGITLGANHITEFADGETCVWIEETVRGQDCFVVQSTCKPVNNNLMELLVTIDALRRASAGRITAVIPYFGYARQDRKSKGRDPITAKLVANMIVAAGAHRVLKTVCRARDAAGSTSRGCSGCRFRRKNKGIRKQTGHRDCNRRQASGSAESGKGNEYYRRCCGQNVHPD